jgi:single-strand DNA-binding protein
MSNLNNWDGQGNLVDDPELVGENKDVARFTVAVNNGFGEHKSVTFVDCVSFGKQAQIIKKHFSKGKPIIVRGSLRQNRWEKDDQKFSKMEVHLHRMDGFHFVGGNGNAVAASDEPQPAATTGAEEASDDLF